MGEEIDSDYPSIMIWIEEIGEEKKGRKKLEKEWIEWIDWSEKARECFREKTEKWEMEEEGKRNVTGEWEDMVKRRRTKVDRKKGWWNKQCREKKKEVGRRWKKRKGRKKDYMRGKKEYKEL